MYNLFGKDDTILLSISGPKAVIRDTLNVSAKMSQSWDEVLRMECGIALDNSQDAIVVATNSYRPNLGKGWITTNLNEPILKFMSKFQVKKPKYCIRLQLFSNTKINPALNIANENVTPTANDSSGQQAQKRQRHHSSFGKIDTHVPLKKRRYSGSGPGVSGGVPSESLLEPMCNLILTPPNPNDYGKFHDFSMDAASRYNNIPDNETFVTNWQQQRTQETNGKFQIPVVEDIDNDDDDAVSQATAADVREAELLAEGITMRPIRKEVEKRLGKFGNSMFLRAQNEMKQLQKRDAWIRNVQRAPLCCHLIEELLK